MGGGDTQYTDKSAPMPYLFQSPNDRQKVHKNRKEFNHFSEGEGGGEGFAGRP